MVWFCVCSCDSGILVLGEGCVVLWDYVDGLGICFGFWCCYGKFCGWVLFCVFACCC